MVFENKGFFIQIPKFKGTIMTLILNGIEYQVSKKVADKCPTLDALEKYFTDKLNSKKVAK